MKPSQSPAEEVLALCERLIEGQLTPDEKVRLERLVLEQPDAKRLYVEYMHQHASLRWQAGTLSTSAPPPLTPSPRRRWRRAAYGAALPAMLLLGLWGARALGARPIATLTGEQGARWEGTPLPTAVGTPLPPGRLRLAQGLATLTFRTGAVVTLEAPAELELVSPGACVLHAGGLVARVPPEAVGFTVRSPTAVVVDHGTEFAVSAAASGATRIDVLSGLVEARHVRTAENVRLQTGQGALFSPAGVGAQLRSEPASGRAPENAAASDRVISSTEGRGRATFVQSRVHPDDRRPEGVLLVKNTEEIEWQRKAYVAFDLTSLSRRPLSDAALTLTLAPTGMGFAAFVPDATFAVYGLRDGTDRDWDEASLTWQNAPGNAPGGAGVDPQRVVRVGAFRVAQGTTSGAVGVRGPALVDFLNADRDGLVTFLIVRETAELRGHGLVHGLAGNHHPTAAPPTLRLTLAR